MLNTYRYDRRRRYIQYWHNRRRTHQNFDGKHRSACKDSDCNDPPSDKCRRQSRSYNSTPPPSNRLAIYNFRRYLSFSYSPQSHNYSPLRLHRQSNNTIRLSYPGDALFSSGAHRHLK